MPSNIYFFSDIDDTLIQTKRKTDFDKSVVIASYDKEGNASSYFYEGTKIFIDTLIDSGIKLVPTTARNLDSYKRTLFYKNNKIENVILNFGGLILKNATVDKDWETLIASQYSKVKSLLTLNNDLLTFLKKENLHLQVKIIDGYYISIYNKNDLDNEIILTKISKCLDLFIRENDDFYIYKNGNSFGILPNFLNKKFAVRYLIDKYKPILTLGAGDNISDLDFMKLTDFKIIPSEIENTSNENTLTNKLFNLI